jgi:hypothetical protein
MGSRLGSALAGALLAAGLAAGTGAAAPRASSNLILDVLVGNTRSDTHIVPRRQTETVNSLHFKVGVNVESVGPDAAADVRVRFHLPEGLRWGADLPDPTENCTSTTSTADCQPGFPLDPNDLSKRAVGWGWDVTASAPGDYALSAEVVESASSDPDTSDNSSAVTVHVTRPVSIGSVKILPAKPKAGSLVTARIAVSAGGDAITPTSVVCAGKVGAHTVPGRATFSSGRATCGFHPARNARGKKLHGTVTVVAGGARGTRTFSVRLR